MNKKAYIGEKLSQLIATKDKSMEQIITDLSVSQNTFSSWLNDVNVPTADGIIKICDYFDITPNELLEGLYKKKEEPGYEDSIVISRIHKLRIRKHIDIQRLSVLTDITEDTLQKIENGACYPTEKQILALCEALDASPNELFNYYQQRY